jgi:hypothetical protein
LFYFIQIHLDSKKTTKTRHEAKFGKEHTDLNMSKWNHSDNTVGYFAEADITNCKKKNRSTTYKARQRAS